MRAESSNGIWKRPSQSSQATMGSETVCRRGTINARQTNDTVIIMNPRFCDMLPCVGGFVFIGNSVVRSNLSSSPVAG
jgi:hypothetical protein